MDFITIGIKVVVAAKQRLDKAEIDARLGDLERAASQLDQRISDGILAQVNAGFFPSEGGVDRRGHHALQG